MSLEPLAATRSFFRRSRAEWTVAKDQNVRLQSGWFSERDACYLASGKPVIAQSTGFEQFLPTGEGLFAFRTMDEVLAAVDTIESDYPKACRAARGDRRASTSRRRACAGSSWRTWASRERVLPLPHRQRRRLRLRPRHQPRASPKAHDRGIVTSATPGGERRARRTRRWPSRASGRGSPWAST